MSNNKDFKVKNGIQPTSYFEGVGTVVSGQAGYNLAGAAYDSVSFSVASQDTYPYGLFFKADGTKLYIVGDTSNSVYQYTLSTAWDVSTATYDSVSLSILGQEDLPTGIFFKPDGTQMYISGQRGDALYQYTLSTAWDLSTASYASKTLSLNQSTNPYGCFFKPDGTKFYSIDAATNTVYQYTLSTAWDVSTGSYDSVSFSVSSQETAATLLYFNDDGTIMYAGGQITYNLYAYTLSTAYDISTATYSGVNFSLASQEISLTGVFFKPDGTKLYHTGLTNGTIYQYSTALNTAELDLSTGSVFEVTPTSDIQVTLSNPADSGTVSGATLLLDGAATTTYSFSDLSDDSKSYSATFGPNSIFFKPDGAKMFLMSNGAVAYQYSLSNPNDITTASYDNVSFNFGSQDAGMSGLFFKADGTKMYATGSVTDRVYQYSLSTAWDLSTASYDSVSFSVAGQDSTPFRLFFKPDGTKMYVDGRNGYKIFQYSLSTVWDLSTASYDSISYTYSSTLSYSLGQFFFTSDGTGIYFISGAVPGSAANEEVVGYAPLSTAWGISTIGARSTFDISSLDTTPYGIQFSVDGTKLFVSGEQNDKVYQLNSSSGATITYDTAIEWPSGTAPTSPAIGETDVITFNTRDGGSTYQGVLAIDGAK